MEARQPAGFEIEWQLEAQDLRLVLRWIEAATDAAYGVTIGPGRTRTNLDTYVDTSDRRLDRAGYSVRLRQTPKLGAEATLKSLEAAGPDALRVRLEVSQQLDVGDAAAIPNVAGPVGDRVRALVGSRKLVPLFDLQTRRRTFPLATADGPSGELLLDETAIRESGLGRILSRLRRVEVEVPEQAIGTVGPLVESMRLACGLQPAILSKYEAALAATGSHRMEIETFGPTLVDPGATIGHVALAVLRRQFAALLANEPGTRLGDDIEHLHDMRVASRRLRAAIGLFEGVLPADAARLRADLAWLGQTIGAVRDLDVQLAQLDEWAELSGDVESAAVAPLRTLLRGQRAAARAEMLLALDSPQYERFVRRFGRMLRREGYIKGGEQRGENTHRPKRPRGAESQVDQGRRAQWRSGRVPRAADRRETPSLHARVPVRRLPGRDPGARSARGRPAGSDGDLPGRACRNGAAAGARERTCRPRGPDDLRHG